jgi:tetratricopeptide (TPR) repeat protein
MGDTAAARFLLEDRQRLSSSMLWRLQRRFFSEQSINAWRQGIVPHYVTSNTFIAQAYARLVLGYLRDLLREGRHDAAQPLYVLELGAGSGRFSYHFLQCFFAMLQQSALSQVAVTFVMSDFSERNLAFWRQHASLQAFVEQGRLDFALIDLSQLQDITLLNSGLTLTAGQTANPNPLVVLANYVFDSIEQDAFYLKDGVLHESLISLHSDQDEPDPDDAGMLERLHSSFANVRVHGDYYAEPELNCLLDDYRHGQGSGHLLLPTQALRYLGHLRGLCNDRLLLISGDKGSSREDEIYSPGPPGVVSHGSISMMVNYHAIGRYTEQQGGAFLTVPQRHQGLHICAALFDGGTEALAARPFLETRLAFTQHICQGGPDDFFVLKRFIQTNARHLSVQQLLAYLRMSGWDAANFWGCYEAFMQHAGSAQEPLRQEIAYMVEAVWHVYYPLGEERDLAFALGQLLYAIEYDAEAIIYLQHSLRLYGDDAGTLYNLAMCSYHLGQLPQALQFLVQALRVDPAYQPAQAMQMSMQHLLQQTGTLPHV